MTPLHLVIPTQWNQLTKQQLISIARMWDAGYSETDFLVKSFLILTGLKLYVGDIEQYDTDFHFYTHRSMKKPFIIDTEMMADLCQRCRFLLTPDELYPLHWIGLSESRHYRLYNASFEEYLMAENFFFAYSETKKEEHLDNLIACLYQYPWQKWNADKIQERAKRFRKLDSAIKTTVFLWYIGFRTYIPKRCKALFTSKGTASGRPFNPREYINGMIHTLSNGDITIKDKLLSLPCWDALDELEQRAIESQSLNS